MTVAVGASLFDDRYGLAEAMPRQLAPMTAFPNDRLEPGHAHGDLLVQVCATDEFATVHALRYLMAGTRETLRLRWTDNGFHRPNATPTPGHTTTRNLMGFKDGSANLNPDDAELLDRLVWIGGGDDEPAWAVGGSYMVVRVIRMFVERWDRTALLEQEKIIGRTKRTGAPLGADREEDIPTYDGDPDGARIPLDAHIRKANPRTPEAERSRILRRGYSYSRGFDDAGLLDQGLLFVCFQRDVKAGFVAIQKRLNGEPLEEFIQPVGGGYFFALPGVTTADGFLGEGLLRADSRDTAPTVRPGTRIHSRVPFGANARTEIGRLVVRLRFDRDRIGATVLPNHDALPGRARPYRGSSASRSGCCRRD